MRKYCRDVNSTYSQLTQAIEFSYSTLTRNSQIYIRLLIDEMSNIVDLCRPSGAVRYKHAAPLGLAKTGKQENENSPNKNRCIVGTTIIVPYNSFLAVPPRLWVVVIRH